MKDIIKMNKLAGLITESQARKIMKILNENEGMEKKENTSNNLTLLKNLFEKVEDLRLEMIYMDLNTEEPDYEIVNDFVETDGENAFNILLNEIDKVISEID